jgi:surface antigen
MGRFAALFIIAAALRLLLQAENICNETPPANRGVDGIPAYAQCSTSTGNVFSNNGIDTRLTSGGAGWAQTQFGGGYQCTELAHRYLAFHWKIKSVPTGDAGTWGDNKLPAGLVKTSTPVHGDIIVFAPGSCGASSTTGHVAVIDVVDGATVTIVEQNNAGRRKCQASCAKYFLHVEANTGIAFSRNAANDADENHGIFVRISKNMVLIQLSGDFTSGASVRIFDLRGRQIADLTDRIQGGQTFFETAARPFASCIVSVRKGSWVACKRILKR